MKVIVELADPMYRHFLTTSPMVFDRVPIIEPVQNRPYRITNKLGTATKFKTISQPNKAECECDFYSPQVGDMINTGKAIATLMSIKEDAIGHFADSTSIVLVVNLNPDSSK